MQKSATRDMLCGRGARKRVYISGEKPHVEEIPPPYPANEIDLVALADAEAEGDRLSTIRSETIGKLGAYSELAQFSISHLADGIFIVEAFPGAGKTTAIAAIDAFLCLVSKDFKILVIAGRHAALDALNGNLTTRLDFSVPSINEKLGADSSERPVERPLVLRAYGNEHAEMMDFVYLVGEGFKSGGGRTRSNSLCHLLLQLLGAGPHHLPEFSKSELIGLATSIKDDASEGFEKLRRFVAGSLTWNEANDLGKKLNQEDSMQQHDGSSKDIGLEEVYPHDDFESGKTSKQTSEQKVSGKQAGHMKQAQDALKQIIDLALPLVNVLMCTTATAAGNAYKTFVAEADLCQNEEAGATSFPQIFSGWRGIGQPLIISGDGAQFGPFMRDYKKHMFREFLATSTLDMIKSGGYPVFHLNTQHRAIDGQFNPVYENFYRHFKSIESPKTQHPDNHPDAQRVEASFVADFAGLEPSPAGLILPMFIHVPNSVCESMGKSKYSPQQTKAALYVVQKLIASDVPPNAIMVIGAYRAQIMELRKSITHEDVLVTTADGVQGQERLYVVFVFGTNKDVGPGFTNNSNRLCVSMSRQKYFLALVGDIDTVDYENFDPSGKDDTVYLARIHKYFVTNQRVGTFGKTKELVRDQAEPATKPFTVDVGDEKEVRLFAQVQAAIVALKDYQASKSKKPVVESIPDSELTQKPDTPSSETKDTTKPKTLRKRLTAFAKDAQQPVLKAAANSDSSWNDSGNAQASDEKTPSNSSHKSGTSGEISMKGQGSGESGHLRGDRLKRGQVACYNCHEVGHKISECKKHQKPIDYSKVQCRRCNKYGHTPTKCDQPPPS